MTPDRIRHPLRTDGAPLYRQVRAAIEQWVLDAPLGEEGPLPPETELMAEFGVSRGTLRRATDDLARAGLLRIEPGNGTFVVQATKVRLNVRDKLAAVALPDSRFDVDLSRFIPDFRGRERCDEQVERLDEFTAARSIFVTPDNSLQSLRAIALRKRKQLIVPTFGMRRGFVLLDGDSVPEHAHELASTLDGMERFGRRLSLDDLMQFGELDLVMTGAVAVTVEGVHFGGGEGNFDLEWGILVHCGLASSQTPILAVVHDCQVMQSRIKPRGHDAVVDMIVTPDRTQRCHPALAKPTGIYWNEILAGTDHAGPYIADLLAQRRPSSSRIKGSPAH